MLRLTSADAPSAEARSMEEGLSRIMCAGRTSGGRQSRQYPVEATASPENKRTPGTTSRRGLAAYGGPRTPRIGLASAGSGSLQRKEQTSLGRGSQLGQTPDHSNLNLGLDLRG